MNLGEKMERHSRHIYHIYKLLPLVSQTEKFKVLVHEVRTARAKTNICPSAQPGANVPELLNTLIENNVYKNDYENITSRILEEQIPYEAAIEAVKAIAESKIFEE